MVGKIKKIFMIHLCNWIKHLDTEEVEEAFFRSAVQTEDSFRMGRGGGEERDGLNHGGYHQTPLGHA